MGIVELDEKSFIPTRDFVCSTTRNIKIKDKCHHIYHPKVQRSATGPNPQPFKSNLSHPSWPLPVVAIAINMVAVYWNCAASFHTSAAQRQSGPPGLGRAVCWITSCPHPNTTSLPRSLLPVYIQYLRKRKPAITAACLPLASKTGSLTEPNGELPALLRAGI